MNTETAKHTAGIWYIEAGQRIVSQKTGDTIARVSDLPHGGDDYDEEEANARLIASAPDLLAACEYILDNLDTDAVQHIITCPRDFRAQLNVSRDMLRAAIAKASAV